MIGPETAKQELEYYVILPSKRRDFFTGMRKPTKGLLLFGPPGTETTMSMLAQAAAAESELEEGARLVHTLFQVALFRKPSVIFIDEIDSIFSASLASEDEDIRMLMSEFRTQFDWVLSNDGVSITQLMEMKMFNSKSLSTSSSQIIMLSSHFLNSRYLVQVKRQFCPCRGFTPRASYSSTSKNATKAIGQQDFLDSYSYRINGSSSSLFFKNIGVLDACDDEYDGVVVNPEKLPSNPNVFSSTLRSSMCHWKIKGKKGVWLKLPIERSELLPIAVKEGFEYHHAEKSYVMLTYWIPDGPCLLPPNASHHVGVGGFVLNDKDEVLVVQEKHCSPNLLGLWKIPTGFIHENEEIYTGAVREVKEETGIDTEFVEVVSFRHAKNVSFEKSDLFFVCMLRPLSTAIVVDDLEIQAAKWMPLDEFVNQPLIQGDNMFKKIFEMCVARLGKRYCGLSVHQLVSKFDDKLSSLYFNIVEDQDPHCQAK
ncbi:hypothetical protein ACJIZ3_003897 [Penstemon smallii]|uniref:Nudix hydrolase domain-containing protein n=1 Tax=Penstemon smallii TaxID=265156 RepID=A0ABD3S0K4_9LAMI